MLLEDVGNNFKHAVQHEEAHLKSINDLDPNTSLPFQYLSVVALMYLTVTGRGTAATFVDKF